MITRLTAPSQRISSPPDQERGKRPAAGWRLLLCCLGLFYPSHPLATSAQEAAPPSAPSVGAPQFDATTTEETAATEWGENEQFRAFGSTPQVRLQFHVFATELRDHYRQLMHPYRELLPQHERHRWTVPIRLDLWGETTDVHKGKAVLTKVEITPENRLLIRLSVRLHDEFEEEEFRLELLRALLLEPMIERHHRNPSQLEQQPVQVPEWILHGLDQLILHRQGGRRSAYYQGFLNSGQPLQPEIIFAESTASRLDPISLEIFRASSSALVDALLDQEPDGALSLRQFLGDLPGSDPSRVEPLLRQHFPSLRELDSGLHKWWALQLSTLAEQHSFEFLSRQETERWLDEAISISLAEASPPTTPLPGPEKRNLLNRLTKRPSGPAGTDIANDGPFHGTLDEYASFLHRQGSREALVQSFGKIQRLSRTAFPLYRPVITGYGEVIEKLLRNDTKNLDTQLAGLREMRSKIAASLEQTEDYLNYYQATHAPKRSEVFDDYIRMRQALNKQETPRRTDRISRHLDLIESEFR